MTWTSKEKEEELARLRGGDDPFAKREEALAEREAGIAEDAKRDPWLALAEGGFRTAAGGSQYAMQNIGEGGRAGLAALVESKEAREERSDRAFDARLALDEAKETRDTKLRGIARDFANDKLSEQERTNAVSQANNEYAWKKFQAETAERKFAYDAQERQRDINLDISRENRANEVALRREGLASELAAQKDTLRLMDIDHEENVGAWTDRKQDARDVQAQKIRAYELADKRLADEEKALREFLSAQRAEEGVTARAQIVAGTPSASVKTARAAMSDPELASMLKHLSGASGKNAAKLKTAISRTWENVMKPYEDGGTPKASELPDLKATFVMMLADEGLGTGVAEVLFDGIIANSGVTATTAGRIVDGKYVLK